MSAKLYKLFFDLSVCYTIGAFLLKGIWDVSLSGWGFLLLFCIGSASVLFSKRRILSLSIILILPVVSLLFLKQALPELVLFLLTWVYSTYVISKGRMTISRGGLIDLIRNILLLFLLLTLILAAAVQNVPAALETACPFFVLVIVSAVTLLRYLRINDQTVKLKGYQKQQFIELFAFLAVSIFLTLLRAPQMLLRGGKLIYMHLIEPIVAFLASMIGMLISGIIYLIMALYRVITNSSEERVLTLPEGRNEQPLAIPPNVEATDINWILPFVYSIGIILCLIALFLFFRKLMGDKWKQELLEDITETREELGDSSRKREARHQRKPEDSREVVRYYYRKTMLWLQHKKVELKPQDTTLDISHKCNQLPSQNEEERKEQTAQLMKLYRNARYHHKQEPILKEDAQQAKKSYQALFRTYKRR